MFLNKIGKNAIVNFDYVTAIIIDDTTLLVRFEDGEQMESEYVSKERAIEVLDEIYNEWLLHRKLTRV